MKQEIPRGRNLKDYMLEDTDPDVKQTNFVKEEVSNFQQLSKRDRSLPLKFSQGNTKLKLQKRQLQQKHKPEFLPEFLNLTSYKGDDICSIAQWILSNDKVSQMHLHNWVESFNQLKPLYRNCCDMHYQTSNHGPIFEKILYHLISDEGQIPVLQLLMSLVINALWSYCVFLRNVDGMTKSRKAHKILSLRNISKANRAVIAISSMNLCPKKLQQANIFFVLISKKISTYKKQNRIIEQEEKQMKMDVMIQTVKQWKKNDLKKIDRVFDNLQNVLQRVLYELADRQRVFQDKVNQIKRPNSEEMQDRSLTIQNHLNRLVQAYAMFKRRMPIELLKK